MSITPPPQGGNRGLDGWYGWNIKLYRNGTISSFEAPISTPEGIDLRPRGLSCQKFDAKKLLFEAFSGRLRIFGSVRPKNECIFPFLHNLIFKPYHLWSPYLHSGGGWHMLSQTFLSKIRCRKTFIWSFFLEYCVFLRAFSPKVNVFFRFCTI